MAVVAGIYGGRCCDDLGLLCVWRWRKRVSNTDRQMRKEIMGNSTVKTLD